MRWTHHAGVAAIHHTLRLRDKAELRRLDVVQLLDDVVERIAVGPAAAGAVVDDAVAMRKPSPVGCRNAAGRANLTTGHECKEEEAKAAAAVATARRFRDIAHSATGAAAAVTPHVAATRLAAHIKAIMAPAIPPSDPFLI